MKYINLRTFTILFMLLYTHNTYTNICGTQSNTMTNFNERTNIVLFKKIISHTLFLKGWCCLCVRDKLETGRDCYIDPAVLLSHLGWVAQPWVTDDPKPSVCSWSQFSVLSPTNSNHLCTWLYYCLPHTYFRCSSTYLHRCISWLTARLRVNI